MVEEDWRDVRFRHDNRVLHERVAAALPPIRKTLPIRCRSLAPRNDVTFVHVRLSYVCIRMVWRYYTFAHSATAHRLANMHVYLCSVLVPA